MNYLGCPFRHFVGVSLFDYSIRHPEKELGFSAVYRVVVDVCAVSGGGNCLRLSAAILLISAKSFLWAASVLACASAAASFIIYESISSVGSSRLVRRYELSSFSVISMGILRQNYELILKRQRKLGDFFILVRVGENGDVFFDRA